MASFQKTDTGWRAHVFRRGVRDTKMFRTKAAAESWAREREAEILGGERSIALGKTAADAFRRYSLEISPDHRGHRWEEVRLQAFEKTVPWAYKRLEDVTQADVASWRDRRLREVSAASVAREWSLLSSVFQVAIRDWGWCKKNPMREAKRPKVRNERDRRVHPREVRLICRRLGWCNQEPTTVSQTIALAWLVSLRTGMRAGEILGLRKADVDLTRRVCRLRETKNGDDRDVPLTRAAARLLRLVAHRDVPFPINPSSRDTLFREACRAVGVSGLTFHDARAEALTRLARKVDPLTLAKISGHRDPRILLTRYYRPDMAEVAARL